MPDDPKQEWTRGSRSIRDPPTLEEVIRFLRESASNFIDSDVKFANPSLKKPTAAKAPTNFKSHPTFHKPKSPVFWVESFQADSCVFCKNGDHILSRCPNFKSWDQPRVSSLSNLLTCAITISLLSMLLESAPVDSPAGSVDLLTTVSCTGPALHQRITNLLLQLFHLLQLSLQLQCP